MIFRTIAAALACGLLLGCRGATQPPKTDWYGVYREDGGCSLVFDYAKKYWRHTGSEGCNSPEQLAMSDWPIDPWATLKNWADPKVCGVEIGRQFSPPFYFVMPKAGGASTYAGQTFKIRQPDPVFKSDDSKRPYSFLIIDVYEGANLVRSFEYEHGIGIRSYYSYSKSGVERYTTLIRGRGLLSDCSS